MGDVRNTIKQACDLVEERIGTISALSSLYRSEPWGYAEQPWFLNAVILVNTSQSPEEVLRKTSAIELELGRIRTENRYGERTIDIDILFHGSHRISTSTLTVPHPHIQERLFVLLPLTEICPDLVHPIIGRTASEMLHLSDSLLKIEVADPPNIR